MKAYCLIVLTLSICYRQGLGSPIEAEIAISKALPKVDVRTSQSQPIVETTEETSTTPKSTANSELPIRKQLETTEKHELNVTTTKPPSPPPLGHPTASKKPITTPQHQKKSDVTATTKRSSYNGGIMGGNNSNIICPVLSNFMSTIPTKEWGHLNVASGGHMKTSLRLKPFLQMYKKEVKKDRDCVEQYLATVVPNLSAKELAAFDKLLQLMIQFRDKS